MKRINLILHLCLIALCGMMALQTQAQTCSMSLTYTTQDSRCMATGIINVTASGGSGNYNYIVTGNSYNINTSSNVIDGLKPGTYSLRVKDISSGCFVDQDSIVIGGNYQDPRFNLIATDVSCVNAYNGAITVSNLQYGTAPFVFTIVSPSSYGIGTSNSTGVFNNLPAGNYFVQLGDSCGGLQTRVITIANYSWTPVVTAATKYGCDSVDVNLTVTDNKGNSNNGNPVFSGFLYGATVTPGDTTWSTSKAFRFYKGMARSGKIIVKDGCGNYQYLNYADAAIPNVNATVSVSNMICGSFNATVTGQQNLTNPQYCLYNSSNVQLTCNTTGVFNTLAYGSYCIAITDNCYDTTFTRCFTVNAPVPSVSGSVAISSLACTDFTAAITGQMNLTSPQYCLFDSTGAQVSCNTTGTFTHIPYGSYCINVTDGCSGTIITRCFTQRHLIPVVNTSVSISNLGCSTFSVGVSGQANIVNPIYCIYDVNDSVVACNVSGVFNNLPYGTYCMHIKNDPTCYDTTLVRCFTVAAPVPGVGAVSITGRTCTGFTATVTGQTNLISPQYCLYDTGNNLITCNTTGQFTNLAYGSYCIHVQNSSACYDTLFTRCFSATVPVPAVGVPVTITNRGCSTFSASITGQSNLTNPTYYLLNASNTAIDSNATGVFNNIPYGAYCISVVNTCYDTTFTRCFSASPNPISVAVSSSASCNLGKTNITVTISNGVAPYTINIYNPGGALVNNTVTGSSTTTISNLPGLPAGYTYKVVANSSCAGKDSATITPVIYTLNKTINANSKCPGGMWLNGSGDLLVNASFSGGAVTPSIIKVNGVATTINYTTQSGSNFTFTNMQPATYIIQYTLQTCGSIVFDTFNLKPYSYPSLNQSAVYQCNNNNFSVTASGAGGLAPFTYEIIGSSPAVPSIAVGPQASNMFTISNGTTYSLVRLRAIDACGNATINDASILPLANTIITASSDCYYNAINLTVDSIPNATYTWYRKTSPVDSILIDTNQTHTIPYLLPSDTGTYVNVMSVNSGCLQKVSSFTVTGACASLLSVNGLSFEGKLEKDNTQLKWVTAKSFDAAYFVIEKSTDGISYKELGSVNVSSRNNLATSQYLFSDVNVTAARNYYRLRVVKATGNISYSNIVEIDKKSAVSVSVMPNPVVDVFNIRFQPTAAADYSVVLAAADGRIVLKNTYAVHPGDSKTINRPHNLTSGLYYLVVVNMTTKDQDVIKLIFK